MQDDTVIKVEGLGKKFTRSLKRSMFYGATDVARNMLGISYDPGIIRKGEFWSLDDVNFELKKGEALGVIGQNGSGKTTLLRLINGIYPPDKGTIMVKGKIGALIAVGAGFHPHMTGRENIYLNGTILGMTKEEINLKYNDIVAFADIGEFIDAPVATYSSGMSVRLGFAIAIYSNPEIILADEVLAVGDLSFTLKCYRKITEFRDNGGTLILVSHGISLVRNTCNHTIWMDQGKVRMYGPTQEVCDAYEKFMLEKDHASYSTLGAIINNDDQVHIDKVEFLDKNDQPVDAFTIGDRFKTRIHYDCKRRVNNPVFSVSLLNPENITVISNFTKYDNFTMEYVEGKGYIDFVVDKLIARPAEYKVTITFTENGDINNILEWHDKSYAFMVNTIPDTVTYGLVNLYPTWSANPHN